MEAPAPEEFLPSAFQAGTSDGQQPLSLHRAVTCTKHAPQTNRSSQEMALQGDAAPWAVTGTPEKSPSPESPQPALSSSSSIQPWSSTLKPSPATKEHKEATPALSPAMPTFGNGDLQPWDSVPAGLQPPAASAAARAGLQPMGLHTPTSSSSSSSSSPGSGSQLQGSSAPPVPRGALPGMLQVSTGRRSKPGSPAASPVPKIDTPALSPAASPVPNPSGAPRARAQAVPPPSPTNLGAPAPLLLPSPAQSSQPSSSTAHPAPEVPSELPAPLGQALLRQFRMSLDAAARGDPLALLPSSPLLSFVLKSSDGMICLQPTQDSPLPTEFPNSSLGGLLSIQQILAAPNSSVLDLASFPLSPPSVVLVRPVFVLLPRDTAQPSPQGHPRVAQLATTVGTPASSQHVPVKTSPSHPTESSVGPQAALSTVPKEQAERAKGTSEPGPATPVPTALRGLSPAVTSAPGHVLDPTVQTMARLPEEMQIPAPHPQQATGTALLSLPAEPGTSPVPPELVATQSLQPSPKVDFTTERPQSPSGAPFLPRGSPEPGSSTGTAGQGGSVPTPSPAPAPCPGCSPSSPLPRALPSAHRLPAPELLPAPAAPSPSSVLPAGNEHSTAGAGVPVPATAPAPSTAGNARLTQGLELELELSPTVPQPFRTTQGTAPAPLKFSTEAQRKMTISGEAVAVLTRAGSSASSPAPAPAPAELLAQASTGQSTGPTKTSPRAAQTAAGKFLGSSTSPAAMLSSGTPQSPSAALGDELGFTPAQPAVSQPFENVSHPLDEVSAALEEISSPLDVSHPLEMSHHLENVSHRLDEVFHPLEKVSPALEVSPPLEEDAMVDPGHSSPGPSARPPTPTAAPGPANELVNPGTNELVHPGTNEPAVNGPELFPGRDLSPGQLPSTEEAEEDVSTREVTDGAAEALGTALGTVVTLEPGALRRSGLRSDVPPRHRERLLRLREPLGAAEPEPCRGRGPRGGRGRAPPGHLPGPGGPAEQQQPGPAADPLVLREPLCQPRGCGGPVLPLPQCTHIQLLQGGSSRAASFSIQLFQMLNHSVAYLHCELRVCLPGQPGCEQGCLESVEPLPQPGDRSSHGNLHSLVSLGPVWRTNNRFLYKPGQGAGPATLLPVLLASLAGCAVLGSAFMGLWLHQRHRAKPSRCAQPGEFQGL
ncbi:hypothetical protein Nmel_017282 [Mimus melanotis]